MKTNKSDTVRKEQLDAAMEELEKAVRMNRGKRYCQQRERQKQKL